MNLDSMNFVLLVVLLPWLPALNRRIMCVDRITDWQQTFQANQAPGSPFEPPECSSRAGEPQNLSLSSGMGGGGRVCCPTVSIPLQIDRGVSTINPVASVVMSTPCRRLGR